MPEDDAPIQRTIHDEDDNDWEDHEESDDVLVRRVQGPTPPHGGVVIDDSGGGDDHGGDDVQGINVWPTNLTEAVQGPTPTQGGVVIDASGGDDSEDTRDFDVDSKTYLVESFASAEAAEKSVQPGSYTLQWVQGLQQPATGDELLELVIHDALINEGVDLHDNIDDMSILLVFMARPGLAAMVAATNAHYNEDDEQPFERQRNEVTIQILQTVAEGVSSLEAGGGLEKWRLDPTREQRSALNIAATRLATYMARPLTARARMTRVERLRYLATLGQPPPAHLLKHLQDTPRQEAKCVTDASSRDASSSRPPTKQGVREGSALGEELGVPRDQSAKATRIQVELDQLTSAEDLTNEENEDEDYRMRKNGLPPRSEEEAAKWKAVCEGGVDHAKIMAKYTEVDIATFHAQMQERATKRRAIEDDNTINGILPATVGRMTMLQQRCEDVLNVGSTYGRDYILQAQAQWDVAWTKGKPAVAEKLATEKPATEKPEKPEKPAAKKPATKKPATEKPTPEKPTDPRGAREMPTKRYKPSSCFGEREASKVERHSCERPLRPQLPKRAKSKRARVKIPAAQRSTTTTGKAVVAHTLEGRLGSTKLKEETLASLNEYWEAVDDGSITIDDLHEAEENIGVLVEKFRHGPNRYISKNFLL